MPAEINSIAYWGEKPWHGLGTELQNPATAAEAIAAAKLDWEVDTVPIYAAVGMNDMRAIPHYRATVRRDTQVSLGVVGRTYTPLQNRDAFAFFDNVVGGKQAMYHVVGALGRGERVWMLAKLPNAMRLRRSDDVVEKYLLLVNSHNGTSSLRMFFTPIRVVCNNTLTAALHSRNATEGIALRHSADITQKVQQAQHVLGFAIKTYSQLEESFETLAAKQITGTWLDEYIADVFPVANEAKLSGKTKTIRAKAKALFESPSNMLPGTAGTAWAAYNCVTEYVDHLRVVRKLQQDPSRQLDNTWLGSGAELKAQALKIALRKVAA